MPNGIPVIQTAYNTLLFTVNAIPAAASQVYKEKLFLQHKRPVDPNYFNLVMSSFQVVMILLISPFVYVLQGLGTDLEDGLWYKLYPSSGLGTNFLEGLQCFIGTLPTQTAQSAYIEEAKCSYSLWITVLHVLCIILVGVAVDKIVISGATKVLYRGISAGVAVAVIAMLIVSLYDNNFNHGPLVDAIYFACTVLLIFGSEVYHRVSLDDATFETGYLVVEPVYETT